MMRVFETVLVHTHPANLDRFIELVMLAKGNRSNKNFAHECQLNPSTITRILRNTHKEACRPDVIQLIAENADPKSGVTLEMLADASGYTVSKKIPELNYLLWELKDTKEIIVNSLENEFENYAIEVKRVSHQHYILKHHELRPTAIFEFNDTKINKWTFKVIHLRNDVDNDTNLFWEGCHASRHKFYSFLAGAYFMHLQSPSEKGTIERYSAIVYNKKLFDFLIELYGNLCFSCYVSIILASPEFHTITDEFVFPSRDGKTEVPFFQKNRKIL